jgi:hypothetical protein
MSMTCADASLAAGEPLGATATEAREWLLVEVRGAWGRDAVADTALEPMVRAALAAFDGKVVLVRRPDRRAGVTLFRATLGEPGGTVSRLELESLDEVPGADPGRGEPVVGPVVLVCAHGRRDACCARLGVPLYDALAPHLAPDRLWQASHLGGHRFAPNVVGLPAGVQLGRIPPQRAPELAGLLAAGRIPLDLYRGRTIYAPPVQAAEILIRTVGGCDGVADLRLLAHVGDLVTFATPSGELTARVEQRPGPSVPASCGAEPEPTARWSARLESSA